MLLLLKYMQAMSAIFPSKVIGHTDKRHLFLSVIKIPL